MVLPMESGADRDRTWVAWEQTARALVEQGRLAWLVGQGLLIALEQLRAGEDPPEPLELWRCLGPHRPFEIPPAQRASPGSMREPSAASPSPSPSPEGGVLDLDGRLADRWLPVLFVGSVPVRGEEVTLAVGVDPSGRKHVVGLWEGSTRHPALARQVVQTLQRRGLRTQPGLLLITDGQRALEAAGEAVWGSQVRIAHCHVQVRQEVLAHLPPKDQLPVAEAWRALERASPEEAERQLQALIESLEAQHPGAAARLRASQEGLLTVPRLRLPPRLAAHLRVAGPVRVTVDHALRWGRSPHPGAAAVRAGLPEAVRRMRRLVGAPDLPRLLEQLAKTN